MDTPRLPSLLADLLLLLHLCFVAFVVLGEALVLLGGLRRWRWVRNRSFRLSHLAAMALVAAMAWTGLLCPLTVWEQELRRKAGQGSYEGSFVGHWAGMIVYHDLPAWSFAAAYTLFLVLVAASWLWVRPGRGIFPEQ